ncbi:MAG: polysaccharide lyase [Myxococcota bacterium]|nr:polysaccharide lyase [Myxococcota bacterium]
MTSARRRLVRLVGFVCLCLGCGRVIDLGTDIVWSTDFESDGLSALSLTPGTGGAFRVAGNPTIATSTEHAHSGVTAVKITSAGTNTFPAPYAPGGAALYKVGEFPSEGYYSAWYFVPRAVPAAVNWNIVRFGYPGGADAGTPLLPVGSAGRLPVDGGVDAAAQTPGAPSFAELFDVRLRYQPSGATTLVLFDHRPAYREESMPSPVPVVPIGRWFQLELFYRNAGDGSGHLSIWLEGTLVYDVARPMNTSPTIYFSVGSLIEDGTPAELFIDDVAISRTRVTPNGVLKL